MSLISKEAPFDVGAREALLDRAMGSSRHIKTSARMREGRLPADGLALVARDDEGRLVGTVRLWNVALGESGRGDGRACLMLGPLAVDPAAQGTGIGGKLMRWALAEAALAGHAAIILVGDPEYYARFGFSADRAAGLSLPGPVERRRFLGLELVEGALEGATGMVRATGDLIPVHEEVLALAS
jgi:predicted N-acetyltransferase YhbS